MSFPSIWVFEIVFVRDYFYQFLQMSPLTFYLGSVKVPYAHAECRYHRLQRISRKNNVFLIRVQQRGSHRKLWTETCRTLYIEPISTCWVYMTGPAVSTVHVASKSIWRVLINYRFENGPEIF